MPCVKADELHGPEVSVEEVGGGGEAERVEKEQ